MASELGLFGLGAFGQLMVRHLAPYFHIKACDPSQVARRFARRHAIRLVDARECASCPIVVLAVPVATLHGVATGIAGTLRPGTIVLDVASVKVKPAVWLQQELPDYVDIICTHPLFGPQSARDGIAGREIAVCPVRSRRTRRVVQFLEHTLKLRVSLTSPAQHDRDVAVVQGLTHLIAKVINQMGPIPQGHHTMSFDCLMQAVDMVRNDSDELFLAIERDNPFAADVRRTFFRHAADLNRHLETACCVEMMRTRGSP